MANCTNCGANLLPTDQFCGSCGTPSATTDATAADTATTVTVDVPEWLTADWGAAAKWAGAAALAAIVAHYAVLLVYYLGLNILWSFDLSLDWGEFLLLPVHMMLGMHGAEEGVGTWLTAIVWIVGSLYFTYRVVQGSSFTTLPTGNPWGSIALRAVKTSLVYAAIIIAGLIVFEPSTSYEGSFFSEGYGTEYNAAAAFFFTVLIVSVGAGWILYRRSRSADGPEAARSIWSAGFSGTWTTILVGVGGLFAFFLLAALLELISNGDDLLARVLGGLLILLVGMLAWTGLDVGLFFMAEAMRFFSGNDATSGIYGSFYLGESEPWYLVGTAIVAAAFAFGGYRAARLTRSREPARMLQAAAIAGGGVAIVYLVATAILSDKIDGFSSGIGLSILWTAASAGGALLYAQSIGVLQKINVNVQRSGQLPPPAAAESCPQCGTAREPEHAFCANCGHSF